MGYHLCKNKKHYIALNSDFCVHCAVISKFQKTAESGIELLEGTNFYERNLNSNLFYLTLKTILKSNFSKRFLLFGTNKNPNLDFEFTEEEIEKLIISLNISDFRIRPQIINNVQENIDSDNEKFLIRMHVESEIKGPLVGHGLNIDLLSNGQEMQIVSFGEWVS
jgi:hypothetical protein